jgi:hypothetical protein
MCHKEKEESWACARVCVRVSGTNEVSEIGGCVAHEFVGQSTQNKEQKEITGPQIHCASALNLGITTYSLSEIEPPIPTSLNFCFPFSVSDLMT